MLIPVLSDKSINFRTDSAAGNIINHIMYDEDIIIHFLHIFRGTCGHDSLATYKLYLQYYCRDIICIFQYRFVMVASAQNIGLTVENNFKFRHHTSIMCHNCFFYHIRDLDPLVDSTSVSFCYLAIATALAAAHSTTAIIYVMLFSKDCDNLKKYLATVVTQSLSFSHYS